MQIELIGCTGAGKSTLAERVCQNGREQGLNIASGEDFLLEQFRLNWVKSRLLRKLWVNLTALLVGLITWTNNRKLYLFAIQLLFQLPIPRLERLGLLRNIIKKIGIYEIVRLRSSDDQIILVDEGVLHVAHNLFVHGSVEVDHAYLSTFADLVPLPDVVVYLKQPEKLLIDRTMKRGHKRIPDRSYRCIAPFIKQAVATFDRLVQYPPVQKKLLIIGDEQLAPAVTHDSGKPVIDLALKIIQRDFMSAVDCQPAEISYVE